MKFKRIQHKESGKCLLATEVDGEWRLIAGHGMDLLSVVHVKDFSAAELQSFPVEDYQDVLPFSPTAYRDFMLYEEHAIAAARGFVKRYMPRMAPLVYLYEKLTGKVFPKLKPSARYYQHPIYYMGSHLNMVTHEQPVAIPSYTQELDYELEMAAVITKPLKNASCDEVRDAIGGFVILNDFSARDVQLSEMQSGFGPMKAKNFCNAISSVVVSADELLPHIDHLKVRVLINDEEVVTGLTSGKQFSFLEAIAYASCEEQLHPGELFGSGTIPGCAGIENGHLLKAGDSITLEIEKIGQLTNRVH